MITGTGELTVTSSICQFLPSCFHFSLQEKAALEDRVCKDLNKLISANDEFIQKVLLEIEMPAGSDWRKESGLVRRPKKRISQKTLTHIWGGNEYFRLFVSHKAEIKTQVADLKINLKRLGIAGFVAHMDIHPTKEWQDEIESALESMDGFLALLTEKYHDSYWTDQEVGFAVARRVPIIAVRMGKDPYGFIGKIQALSAPLAKCPIEIAKLLIKHERMLSGFVKALPNCRNFDTGNSLAQLLPLIERVTPTQIDVIVAAFNENDQLRTSYGWNGARPDGFGTGLLPCLNKWDKRVFSIDDRSQMITVAPEF